MADSPQDPPRHVGRVVRRVLLRRNIAIDAETAQLVAVAVQAVAPGRYALPAAAPGPACSCRRLRAAVLSLPSPDIFAERLYETALPQAGRLGGRVPGCLAWGSLPDTPPWPIPSQRGAAAGGYAVRRGRRPGGQRYWPLSRRPADGRAGR